MDSRQVAKLQATKEETKADLVKSIELSKLAIQWTFPYSHCGRIHMLRCAFLEGILLKTLVSWSIIFSFDGHFCPVHIIVPYFKEELLEAKELEKRIQADPWLLHASTLPMSSTYPS